MAHFAQIDENNIVTQVIVAEQEFIDSGAVGPAASWIQTSYNTHGNVHAQAGTPLRKNFAGIGYTYDAARDAFIPPQPAGTWQLNEDTGLWQRPKPYPVDRSDPRNPWYTWDEQQQDWIITEDPLLLGR